jgi:hypothetical protein
LRRRIVVEVRRPFGDGSADQQGAAHTIPLPLIIVITIIIDNIRNDSRRTTASRIGYRQEISCSRSGDFLDHEISAAPM